MVIFVGLKIKICKWLVAQIHYRDLLLSLLSIAKGKKHERFSLEANLINLRKSARTKANCTTSDGTG
jgi:hypothetical protein